MPILFGGGCAKKSYAIALIASEKLNAQAKLNTTIICHIGESNVWIQEIMPINCK